MRIEDAATWYRDSSLCLRDNQLPSNWAFEALRRMRHKQEGVHDAAAMVSRGP